MTLSSPARRTVASCLLVTAALSAVSSALAPAFPSGYAEQLAEFAGAGARAWWSALAFVAAQLPFGVALVGLCLALRGHTPRLATAAGVLTLLGAFGHAVYGGVSLTALVLAADQANRDVHAGVLADVESSPVVAFAAAGLLGTVVGLLLLTGALWRGRVVARWVPLVLLAFLVVEFAGSAVTEWSSQVAAVLYVLAFGGLARLVLEWPSPRSAEPARDRRAATTTGSR